MSGYVYVMGSDQWPYVKIGHSKDPVKRLWFVQVGSPVRLRLLATYEGAQNLETALHRYFERHRTNGEWFDLGDSAVERMDAAVHLGLGPLLAQRDDRKPDHSRTVAAVHPMTGKEFASEHSEWSQSWPDLATRFPPARSAEKGMGSSSARAEEEEHHLPAIVPALHPVSGRKFAPQHLEWFQHWPDFDARFPPERSAGGTR